jgi:hypothetical protein
MKKLIQKMKNEKKCTNEKSKKGKTKLEQDKKSEKVETTHP